MTIVQTQKQLDKAVAAGDTDIIIDSPVGVRLTVTDSSQVDARGSSQVVAWDSSQVVARDSSQVVARGSSQVDARDSSQVVAWDSSQVVAAKYVAVHLHSARASVQGGVVIDVSALDMDDPQTWADYTGVDVVDGMVRLYKNVDDAYQAGQNFIPTTYTVGEDVTCTDWLDDNNCGGGLHASPHPQQALAYGGHPRMLLVEAPLADIRPIGSDKAKAKAVHVIREVSLDGGDL